MEHHESPMLTDLYQLTMLQSYLDQGMNAEAVFEFFVRKLPKKRNFLVAAGLEQLLTFLEQARFSESELEYLAQSGFFKGNLIDYLAGFRFSGSVHAVAEGTVFFADEPVVRVTAPLPEAQLIETRLINILQFQTMIATKAARCSIVGPGKTLVEFGLRRAHGAEAGLLSARACYIGGFAGTSNVLAGRQYAIPIMGTMAHSYIQAHDDEREAFLHFAHSQPDNVVLLIDTYDTAVAAQRVADIAPLLRAEGVTIKAVRIDSGDLGGEAERVRAILDHAGEKEIGIFASSSVDEYLIKAMGQRKAAIDGYGIGSSLTTSADAPYLNCAYKLQEYAGVARRKRSRGKATWPGRKQVYRYYQDDGVLSHDLLCCEAEPRGAGESLINPVMANGRRCHASPSLTTIRMHVADQIARLSSDILAIDQAATYRLEVSERLRQLAERVDRQFA